MKLICRFTIFALLLAVTPVALGHYLWVDVDAKPGKHGTVNVYFEHSAAPGDGGYLDPFVKAGKTWIRTIDSPKAREIEMKEIKRDKLRWLSAEAPAGGPRSIDSYGKFGVYKYGQTNVLLHYYARQLQVNTHDELHELCRAEHLDLDIIPHDNGDKMELFILWRGKLAKNTRVYVRGPKGFKMNPTTNDKGHVSIPIKEAGQYLFRTLVEEDKAGKDTDGQTYEKIRHNATMIMTLPVK